jgi:DNA-binding response OmpR family regulator
MDYKILIIDDGTEKTGLIQNFLRSFDLDIIHIQNILEALKSISINNFDFILLDIMLPGIDWLSVLKKARKLTDAPLIVLTPHNAMSRVMMIDTGADDCITKPFELLVKIQAIIRRSKFKSINLYIRKFEGMTVNQLTEKIIVDDFTIQLSHSEFELLKLFINNSGRVLDREYLVKNIRGIQWNINDRSIDLYISRLRKKILDNLDKPRFIKTIHGIGYKFLPQKFD